MNKVILMGRLTRDPEVRYSQGEQATAIARYTVAVDRRFRRDGDSQTADFIGCVAFGRQAEFAEKYLRKGTKIALTGRIQTGSYTNRDGQKVYTTDVVVEEQEFAESKAASAEHAANFAPADRPSPSNAVSDGFMNIPDGIDEELPFNQESTPRSINAIRTGLILTTDSPDFSGEFSVFFRDKYEKNKERFSLLALHIRIIKIEYRYTSCV